MAWWRIKAILTRKNYFKVVGIKQPRPIFFSEEEIERMSKQEGSFQWQSDSN